MAKRKFDKPFRAEPVEVPHEVREALDVGLEISRIIDEDVDERAVSNNIDYFESVEDKAKSICKTIEDNNRVSEKQRAALDRMLAGVRKWVHDDD